MSKNLDFLPKTDIRQLIKLSKSSSDSVDHPYARVNALGRISCVLCGVQIKSKHAWAAHLLSKTHKQNAVREAESSLNLPSHSKSSSDPVKVHEPLKKARKIESVDTKLDEGTNGQSRNVPDDAAVQGTEKSTKISVDDEPRSAIPEGFFDDPYKDAKMRNVPYKDKMDEEVNLFQKQMIALEKESEAITEKENELRVSRRELEEIDSQMEKWERIEKLLLEKESLGKKIKEVVKPSGGDRTGADLQSGQAYSTLATIVKQEGQSSDSDLNDDDINELYDFRRKKTV